MQRSCIITGILALRHLKIGFFPFKYGFEKKEQNQLKLPDYVEVSYDKFY